MFLWYQIIWPVIVVAINLVVDPPAVPSMTSFETIKIVQPGPADAPLEAVLIVHIPALKFPVAPEPAGRNSRPGVRVVMLHVVRPVLDFVRRCIRRT